MRPSWIILDRTGRENSGLGTPGSLLLDGYTVRLQSNCSSYRGLYITYPSKFHFVQRVLFSSSLSHWLQSIVSHDHQPMIPQTPYCAHSLSEMPHHAPIHSDHWLAALAPATPSAPGPAVRALGRASRAASHASREPTSPWAAPADPIAAPSAPPATPLARGSPSAAAA